MGDIVYKRNPGLNKCLDASWDGPYVVHQLLPPVNCSITPQNRRSKPKVVHLSQLKKSQPVYRTLLVPEECAPDEFQAPIDNSEPLELTPTQKARLDTI